MQRLAFADKDDWRQKEGDVRSAAGGEESPRRLARYRRALVETSSGHKEIR
jgi:hypothetical protein